MVLIVPYSSYCRNFRKCYPVLSLQTEELVQVHTDSLNKLVNRGNMMQCCWFKWALINSIHDNSWVFLSLMPGGMFTTSLVLKVGDWVWENQYESETLLSYNGTYRRWDAKWSKTQQELGLLGSSAPSPVPPPHGRGQATSPTILSLSTFKIGLRN